MAPSAEVVGDLKPRGLDIHDWRYNGHNGHPGHNGLNGQYSRPILIKVEKSGKNSWSLKEVTPLKETGSGALESTSEPLVMAPLLPDSKPEKADKLERVASEKFKEKEKELPRLQKTKSSRQYAWLLLLQAHRAAGCLAWMGMGALHFFKHMKKRLLAEKLDIEDSDQELEVNTQDEFGEERRRQTGKVSSGILLSLRILAAVSILMLVFELISHSSELELEFQLSNPTQKLWPLLTSLVTFHQDWASFRSKYIAPGLQWVANACTYLFLIQSADRIILFLGFLWVKLLNIKPTAKGSYDDDADPERPGESYPMVMVQMPMCNEQEVFQMSIAACCQLEWPRNRFLIQVLDDSSDDECAKGIEEECAKWAERGIPIKYRRRIDRKGYKAGNLDDGMKYDYVKQYEYVAIFDADFQPKPDFLLRTVPHFKDNPDVALVQARWSFVNKDENLLTKLQNINLAFHFEVEQQVNGHFLGFFGFNGTAGVWRISALEDSGGWLDRTTVEDMDIAVRAHLKGWRFVFLNDVDATCELPESYEAYRKQQHRWHSGPMQLMRLCMPEILESKIAMWKKLNVVFLFFLLRKMILPFYSFTLFCIILPVTMFVPEAGLPLWVVCYIPGLMSIMNVLPCPRYFPFMIPYLLFENTMSVTKFQAMVSGLFQLKSSHEWVVTKKTGAGNRVDLLPPSKSAMCLSTTGKTPSKFGSLPPVAEEGQKKPGFFPRTTSEPMLLHTQQRNGGHPASLTVTIPQSSLAQPQAGAHKGQDASPKEGSPTDVQPTNVFPGIQPRYVAVATKPEPKKSQPKKMYRNELALALLLLVAAGRSLLSVYGMHFYFLLFQGATFLVVGLDLISDKNN